MDDAQPTTPREDINVVLARHSAELMAIPGVVGVYVGLLEDNQRTCIKVMLARHDKAAESKIPGTLDGYPVRTEISGEIRPFR